MRDIKFRGFNKARNEWVYGSFVQGKDASYIVDAPVQEGIPTQMIEVEHVCEFTGLFDKNGKPIFEEDILASGDRVRWEKESCGFEPFSDSEGNCGCCGNGLSPNKCEVIGDIYSSPELLK